MASLPPELAVSAPSARKNSAREVIAFVPQIGELTSRGGLDYDMAISEEITHANQLTRHAIEDPTRSFIYDHNKEEPVTINLSLVVSSEPLVPGSNSYTIRGVDRITRFQDALLEMRAAQSVGASAYFDVYTGLRIYKNMAIENITFRRDPATPNMLEVDLTLVEFRFALSPRSEENAYLMDANTAPRSVANAELVDDIDRPLVEAKKMRFTPRYITPSRQLLGTIREGVRRLAPIVRSGLRVDTLLGAVTGEGVRLLAIADVPAQRFIVNLLGTEYGINFDYNQLADRWSFSAAVNGALCPLRGGQFIEPGFNLFGSISDSQLLVAIDRPGISTTGLSWYARMTKPLSDGAPATMLVTGSVTAFNGLFAPRTTAAC